MNLTELTSAYQEKNYASILEESPLILESLDSSMITLLLKSMIHTYGEDDPRVKDSFFLMLYTARPLRLRGSFTLDFDIPKTYREMIEFAQAYEGMIESLSSTTSMSHVTLRVHAHIRTLSRTPNNQEKFLLFMFYCLELYDLEHVEYPMIKWLLHHFYKHD